MKIFRATCLATLLGLSALANAVPTVAAQSMFVDQVSAAAPTISIDPQVQELFPFTQNIATGTATPTVSPVASDNGNLFSTIFIDNSAAFTPPKVATSDIMTPIASVDELGISTYFSSFHPGIDIRAKFGTPIRAMLTGTVTQVGFEAGGYGRYAIIVHHREGKTLFSLYAHMKEVKVAMGDTVTSGQQIGEVGLTGHTTGAHLHFEIHNLETAVNPLTYFDGDTIILAKQ